MTRVTQYRKKTHLEASGFAVKPLVPVKSQSNPSPNTDASTEAPCNAQDASKKRHRFKKNLPKPDESTINVQNNEEESQESKRRRCMSSDKQHREVDKRKDRRKRRKMLKTICFLCRQRGHSIQDCPKAPQTDNNPDIEQHVAGICYKCGSTEHKSSQCRRPVPKDNPFPFATCFVCKQVGHLASQCELNERGLYPNGGSCKYCGSVRHLAKDCKPIKEDKDAIELGLIDLAQGGDDDDVSLAVQKRAQESIQLNEFKKRNASLPTIKKKKVVVMR